MQLEFNYLYNFVDINILLFIGGMGPLVAGGPMVVRHILPFNHMFQCVNKTIRVYKNSKKADI